MRPTTLAEKILLRENKLLISENKRLEKEKLILQKCGEKMANALLLIIDMYKR